MRVLAILFLAGGLFAADTPKPPQPTPLTPTEKLAVRTKQAEFLAAKAAEALALNAVLLTSEGQKWAAAKQKATEEEEQWNGYIKAFYIKHSAPESSNLDKDLNWIVPTAPPAPETSK